MSDRHISKACGRLIRYSSPAPIGNSFYESGGPIDYSVYHSGQGTEAQRVWYADTQTGRHDCRVALCVAMGVPMDLIGPLGHDLSHEKWSPAVYEPVRAVGPDGTYYLETP